MVYQDVSVFLPDFRPPLSDPSRNGCAIMYKLMRSKKLWENAVRRGQSSYEQREIAEFARLENALSECRSANRMRAGRYYVLDGSGKEFYNGEWID